MAHVRTFDTGATRDDLKSKPDYEGYLSPLVIERFGAYMLAHQQCEDGSFRASDNWQRGIPLEAYLGSAFRHFLSWWKFHRRMLQRGDVKRSEVEESLCALLFNVQGYLHELLKVKECA